MNKITDISPIAQLKELELLEIYQNYVTDVSPLVELPKLKYLNLSRNSFTDVTPLLQMHQLKMLWLASSAQIPSETKLQIADALPECEVRFYGTCGSGGWCDNELYFEYQSAFNLPSKP
jgi:Leucine-rich repeat (LRR) protein